MAEVLSAKRVSLEIEQSDSWNCGKLSVSEFCLSQKNQKKI